MEQERRGFLTDNQFRQKVASRAYEIYEDRGGQHGRDFDDWLQAETDLLAETRQQQVTSPERMQTSGPKSAEAPKRDRKPQRPTGTTR